MVCLIGPSVVSIVFFRDLLDKSEYSIFSRIFAHSKTPDRMKHAYVFPGQGSQVPGMGKNHYESSAFAKILIKQDWLKLTRLAEAY